MAMNVRKMVSWVVCAGGWVCAASPAVGSPVVWMEGERPASSTFAYETGGWGNSAYLSEGAWLHFSIAAGDVEQAVPAGGGILSYDFAIDEAGSYAVWNRAGFEFIRSPFEWRVDDGPWSVVTPTENLSTDLMEIVRWCEVAWVPMGRVTLDPGSHRLDIRFAIGKDADGKVQRLIYTSDALVLSRDEFRPNGKHPPGAAWRTERDRAAEDRVFRLPESPPGVRSEVALHGDWQYARFDEPGRVGDGRTRPVAGLPDPATLHWSSLAVPGDRNAQRPDQVFCHRYILRTRVSIPT